MVKKKNTGQSVTLNLSEIQELVPDKLQLPSGPTQGVYEKNLRDNYSNQNRQFFKNYDRDNRYSNPQFSSSSRGHGFASRDRDWSSKTTAHPTKKSSVNIMPDFSNLQFREKTASSSPSASLPASSRPPGSTSSAPPTSSSSSPSFAKPAPSRSTALAWRPKHAPARGLSELAVSTVDRDEPGSSYNQRHPSPPRRQKDLSQPPTSLRDQTRWDRPAGRRVEKAAPAVDFGLLNQRFSSGRLQNKKAPVPLNSLENPSFGQAGHKAGSREAVVAKKTEREGKNVFDDFVKVKAPVDGIKPVSSKKPDEIGQKMAKNDEKTAKKVEKTTEKTKENLTKETPKVERGNVLAEKLKRKIEERRSEENAEKASPKVLSEKTKSPSNGSKMGLSELVAQKNEDVLTKMKKKLLQLEQQKLLQQQNASDRQRCEREQAELKELESMMAMKRNESVEFFGYYKNSNKRVGFSLWKSALKHLFVDNKNRFEDEFKKLTAWCLKESVLSINGFKNELAALFALSSSGEASENAQFVRTFLADVLNLFSNHFSEKSLLAKIKKEGVDIQALFALPDEGSLIEFLSLKGLSFLAPRESLASRLLTRFPTSTDFPGASPDAILRFLLDECKIDDIRAEPEVAFLLAQPVFRDYFALVPRTTQCEAVAIVEQEHDGHRDDDEEREDENEREKRQTKSGEDGKNKRSRGKAAVSEDESNEARLETLPVFSVHPIVSEFFKPSFALLHFLRGVSLMHQRDLLHALSLEWQKAGAVTPAAEALMRAVAEMQLVDYEGICEWRHSIPTEEQKEAKRGILMATGSFLDGDLELRQMRLRKKLELEEYASDGDSVVEEE